MHLVKRQDRRFFLNNLTFGTLAMLGSCAEKSAVTNEYIPQNCDDYTGLDETDLQLRKGFGYVKSSPMAESQCKNCNLYKRQPGHKCGGCTLFKGPVFDEGYCTYWAPIIVPLRL